MTSMSVLQIFIPATISFLIGMVLTPFVTHVLYKYKMWKPKSGKVALDGTPAETFNQLHEEVGTPRFGGSIVWGSVFLTAIFLQILVIRFPIAFKSLAFVTREQTWMPLSALAIGAIVGFIDDLFEVRGRQGIKLRVRLCIVAFVSFFCGYWFYQKLAVSSITLPFLHQPLMVGIWIIPIFILVSLFIYAGGVIDGIDGLAGGEFTTIFVAYAGIAYFQHQYDLASLCAAIGGGLLAFLWFNIPPARFYLSETGTMALTLALTVVAFLTDTIAGGKGLMVLPIIAFPLVLTVLSNIVQIVGKKVFKRKIFRIAPLHHHFEAIGWPSYKVVMRYWIVGVIVAILGMAIALL